MRNSVRILVIIIFLAQPAAAQNKIPGLIPKPVAVSYTEGTFRLKNYCTVSSNFPKHDWAPLLSYFRQEMKTRFNIDISEVADGKAADFAFKMLRMPTSGKPAYKMTVDSGGILVSSNFSAPAFHAMQTLFQLISGSERNEIPLMEIFDYARFNYRGMHLDVARHFFPVSFIKKYIDYLAFYKFNTFHWHLTDDQGWRIEIKKYPRLTAVGSWRNGTIIGRYPGKGNDNTRYGGYYTQAQIKEVVAYAAARFIDVIPEIEMPGHGSAAIAAYPWLSCFPGKPTSIPATMIAEKSIVEQNSGRIKLVQETWGVFDDVFCAGNDSTFLFLQNVIDEVAALFPSRYFHIGADECPKTHWKICPKCQKRIKELGLKDEHELQSWFVQKMERYLHSKDKTLIGWDEILEGGLAPNAVVMSWRGESGGIEAAKQKHAVIMTPGNPLYFDYSQSANEDSVTIGGYNHIEKVYAYNPIPKELTADEGEFILGAQANMWSEYLDNPRKVEYMLFPRIAALSEVLWTPLKNKNWDHFGMRLQQHMNIYRKENINYSKAYFDFQASVVPAPGNKGVKLKLKSRFNGAFFRDCFFADGTSACISEDPLDIRPFTDSAESIIVRSGEYAAMLLADTTTAETSLLNSFKQRFDINLATGKSITLSLPASSKYPGDGAFTLVNGIQNKTGLNKSSEFLGFEGTDCEVIIDLGVKTTFKEVVINSLTQTGSWIYPPKYAEFTVSDDGITYHSPGNIFQDIEPYMDRKTRLQSLNETFSGRYLKIFVRNFGKIPEGRPGASNPSWLFIDEIEVR